jgi:uncharacterized pyridoxamine 5'-phosphate oxidase family protein
MAEEDPEKWERLDLGNDRSRWAWALGRIGPKTTVPFATFGEDGPRVRPLTVVPFGGGAYVLTFSEDAKVGQLQGDPRFEFYILAKEGEGTGYVRFRGEVEFVEDLAVRRDVYKASGFGEKYWDDPADPTFVLLRLDIRGAEILPPGEYRYELLSR